MIYVVFGSTGEYSDHKEWTVRAFTDEQAAKDHVVALDRTWREALVLHLAAGRDDYDFANEYACDDGPRWLHPLDPGFKHDYNGTNYWYEAVLVDEEMRP